MEYQHQQCQFLMYFRYRGATKGAEPFFENNVNIDVIQSYASFDEYQVLLLPVMIVYKKEVQEKIREFVKAGKTVLLRFINSVKDYYNNLTLNEFNPINFTSFYDFIIFILFSTRILYSNLFTMLSSAPHPT